MIRKQIIEKIYTEVFLYYLTLKEINTDYFINEIEKGIKTVSNKNNRTYVQGEMTDWTYFNRNKELHKVLAESFKYLKILIKSFTYLHPLYLQLIKCFCGVSLPHDIKK